MRTLQTNESGLIPCGHRIVVKPIEIEEVTAGGIVLPGEVRDREEMKQIEAIVIAVGPSAWADQAVSGQWAEVGDKVMIAKFSGLVHVTKAGVKYRVIST